MSMFSKTKPDPENEMVIPSDGTNRGFRRKFNAVLMAKPKKKRKAKSLGIPQGQQGYISRTMIGMCKNLDCDGIRRDGSAYCQKCSDKNNKNEK